MSAELDLGRIEQRVEKLEEFVEAKIPVLETQIIQIKWICGIAGSILTAIALGAIPWALSFNSKVDVLAAVVQVLNKQEQPPKWFENKVAENERRLDAIDKNVRDLEKTVLTISGRPSSLPNDSGH